MKAGARSGHSGAVAEKQPERRLWSRDFKLFFLSRAVARLGDTMLPVALAAGLLQQGHSATSVGVAMAVPTVSWAVLVIFAGVIADRVDPRRLMIGADLLRLVSQSFAAGIFFSGHVALWQILVIGLVNGGASAVFQPGVASTVRQLSADAQQGNGAIRTVEAVMSLVGPAAAGLLVAVASAGSVFAVHAGTYAASALCLWAVRPPDRAASSGTRAEEAGTTPSATGGMCQGLGEGWRAVRVRPWLWGVLALWSFFALTARGPTTPLIATEMVQQHGVTDYGLVNSALGCGTVVGGILAMRLRPAFQLRAGAVGVALFAVFPFAVGSGLPVPVIAAGAVIGGLGMAFWGVMWATSIQTQVPHEVLNRVYAYDIAGSIAFLPVGEALAGPAAELFGRRSMLLAGAVCTMVVSVALLSVPAIRRLRRVDGQV
ncbi:MFS transporter [Streptomyces sp. JV184]|uniref:MFS transporter n=1 Tax=Streptomyces sp. JV184 TaxID=858637 RepID=UPI002E773D6D|nr:MFS transporter [Streptomyces sp. JV184]MEE1748617.1 MFS transporter [Streptomyces sp. JV184]